MGLVAFWCHPVSSNWSPEPGQHLCSAVHSISSVTISTFTNIATDFVILSIPISTLMATALGRKEKAGLVFVFLMGSVSIIAALVRFVTLKLVQSVPKASITHTIDVWALVEIVSSIIAVCLPSLRTFVRRHRVGVRRLPSRSNSGTGSLEAGNGVGVKVAWRSAKLRWWVGDRLGRFIWLRSDDEGEMVLDRG